MLCSATPLIAERWSVIYKQITMQQGVAVVLSVINKGDAGIRLSSSDLEQTMTNMLVLALPHTVSYLLYCTLVREKPVCVDTKKSVVFVIFLPLAVWGTLHWFSLQTSRSAISAVTRFAKVGKKWLRKICGGFQIQFGWQICEDGAHGGVLWASHTARSQLAV